MSSITRHSHRAVASVLFLSALLAGCVQGAGPITSETRDVRPFSTIEIGAGIRLEFRVGSPQVVTVSAQSNILPAVATDVSGAVLTIDARDDFTTSEPVTVTVAAPTLAELSMSGGAQAWVDGIDAAALQLTLKGGARAAINGSVASVTLTADGGSAADLGELVAGSMSVTLSGGATATVNAATEVAGSASAGSRLKVLGGPRVTVAVSGGAEVTSE